jgi:glutamate-ammonia-ligase adenylyltransferase
VTRTGTVEVQKPLRRLAEAIGQKKEIAALRGHFAARLGEESVDLAVLLACAYPAIGLVLDAHADDALAIARSGTKTARDGRSYRRAASLLVGDGTDSRAVMRGLRILARREKIRVALRELLPNAGSDVDVTARELSELADTCIGLAFDEAQGWAAKRFGVPLSEDGGPCAAAVIGMGKLGGRELNAGSDVDLMVFYETDDGAVHKDGKVAEQTLHDHFTRVTQRFIATLEDLTEDGNVWRVDMRLRPEGSRGPLVNALASAERYYETWGRTWERVALVRARPVAGDLGFGKRLLDALAPFVWRRAIEPRLADGMIALAERARVELATDPERDLKLGTGGIREAEFFVQALQLIWGGRDARLRSPSMLSALRSLRARGLVTDREGREVEAAYLVLRRLEHRVQYATGLQTHSLPERGELLDRIARSLGFATTDELEEEIALTRRRVHRALLSLRANDESRAAPEELGRLFVALDSSEEAPVLARLEEHFEGAASPDLARHMLELARRPDSVLGAATREKSPELAANLVSTLAGAADPEQAARFMARFFARLSTPSVYASALSEEPWALRRLVNLFGSSAFLGEAIVGHPDLADRLVFSRGAPTVPSARLAVDEEIAKIPNEAALDPDAFVGALRRAKGLVVLEVGFADLAEEMGTRGCTATLSALADAIVDRVTRFALREQGADDLSLAVIAMGKLGGNEIGYGSDLDLVFVYDDREARESDLERSVRVAQRVLRLLSLPHGEGPGYALDTRLRPSGNQGLLVVSLDVFARYHGLSPDADPATMQGRDWERQALIKARPCAGSAALGEAFLALAHTAAYKRGAPPPDRVHHLRARMERELAGERRQGSRARYDLKLGRGGLVDVEFAAQWLQMKHGMDVRVRTPETETALGALETCGYLDPALAASLREGYGFLRRIEQRLRILHGASAQLIEEGAPGLPPLARRMGMRDGPQGSAADSLLTRYREVTEDVRATYLAVLGLVEEP